MKREGYLYQKFCSAENLQLAEAAAGKKKSKKPDVISFRKHKEKYLDELQHSLSKKKYKIGEYSTFSIYEPKERLVYKLPYLDRVVQHAIVQVSAPIFLPMFTADTFSAIPGRGTHSAGRALKKALQDVAGTQYCLKLDIKKFYPSVDHDVMKGILRRKIKDQDFLGLMDGIIDSAEGLPIGNYLSQYFANLYLTSFDHWLKEVKKVKNYFRYADDMVILAATKAELHQLLAEIKTYLFEYLHILVKDNYQVFPVAARGIDFVGYVFFHTHTRLRPRIKKNFGRAIYNGASQATIASYMSWASPKHANTRHLLKKLSHAPV